ncbi:MAG: oligosaccharide flippase family protein, partial [Elusimicrobiota bacterium]
MTVSRNFFWKISGSLLGGGVYFAFTMLLIKRLGPDDYGRLAFAVSWAGLFGTLVDYGFNPIVSRDLARAPERGWSYLVYIGRKKLILAAVAALLLVGISFLHPRSQSMLPLILAGFVFWMAMSFAETIQAFSYAYENFRAGACLLITQKWLIAALGVAALLRRAGVLVVMSSMALASSLAAALGYIYYLRRFRRFVGQSFDTS